MKADLATAQTLRFTRHARPLHLALNTAWGDFRVNVPFMSL